MRKLLMLMVAFALVCGVASASSLFIVCSNPGAVSVNGANTFASTPLFCPQFSTLPAGDSLYSVTIKIEDSFNQANPFATSNSFTFTYTSIDADLHLANGALPNTCVTSGVGASTTCVDTTTGSGGTLFALGLFYQLGNVIGNPNPATYVGAGNFLVADVSGGPGASGGTLLNTGQISSSAFVTYTYGPAVTTPEPVTMMLVGGGLLGLGLLVTQRRKKA